jgi:ubiquinone/menaquinone biosynthesis C-methylase UbiE
VSGALILDQLVRFGPVLSELERRAPGTVLDVGSGASGITALLGSHWEATALDSDPTDYGASDGPADDAVERIAGDVREMPFADRSFDVVTSIDMMEHLAPSDRPRALAEIARVARRTAIIVCPTGARGHASDGRLSRFYEGRGAERQQWLEEHLAHPFPEPSEVEEGLAPLRIEVMQGYENTYAHELVMRGEAYRRGSALSQRVAARVAGLRVEGLAWRLALKAVRGFDAPPAYRMLVIASRDGAR